MADGTLPPPVAYTWADEDDGHPYFTHLAYIASHHKGRGKVVDDLHPEDTVRRLLAAKDERIRVLTEALRALDNYVCNAISTEYPTGVDLDAPAFRNARKLLENRNG